jgi:hypothetical protein
MVNSPTQPHRDADRHDELDADAEADRESPLWPGIAVASWRISSGGRSSLIDQNAANDIGFDPRPKRRAR